MNQLTTKRDNSIDLLRFIGLTSIMIAHVAPPSDIFQIRTFDVSLMIFISGLSYAGRSISSYGQFIKKRLLRLLVPVYTFLIFYFLINFLCAKLGFAEQIATNRIIGTFLLQLNPSIGFLWIIRIFLIMMLVTPLLVKLESKIKSNLLFIVTIAGLLLGQFFLTKWLIPLKLGRFVTDYLLYLGYSVPFLLGLRIKNATKGFQWILVALTAASFIYMAFDLYSESGKWLIMQRFKYPPKVYYLLWGSMVSTLLWTTRKYWTKVIDCKLTYFIAQNTIWIYLWHILLANPIKNNLTEVNWAVRLVIVYGFAISVFAIQNKIVDILDKKGKDSKGYIKQYFKG